MEKLKNPDQGHYGNFDQAFLAHKQWAEETGDQDHLKVVIDMRLAIVGRGLTPSHLGYMNPGEAYREDGKVAIGSFAPANGKISLGNISVLQTIAEKAGWETRELVEGVIGHEEWHEASHEAEGAEEATRILVYLFGHEAAHAIEEASASFETTEAFDAYGPEREEAKRCAALLRISFSTLVGIRREGRYEELYGYAQTAGLLGAANDGGYPGVSSVA